MVLLHRSDIVRKWGAGPFETVSKDAFGVSVPRYRVWACEERLRAEAAIKALGGRFERGRLPGEGEVLSSPGWTVAGVHADLMATTPEYEFERGFRRLRLCTRPTTTRISIALSRPTGSPFRPVPESRCARGNAGVGLVDNRVFGHFVRTSEGIIEVLGVAGRT